MSNSQAFIDFCNEISSSNPRRLKFSFQKDKDKLHFLIWYPGTEAFATNPSNARTFDSIEQAITFFQDNDATDILEVLIERYV